MNSMDVEKAIEEKAMLLQHSIAMLKQEVENQKRTLNKERELSADSLNGAHFPTCPLSDLADISPDCTVHGHLSEHWKNLVPQPRYRGLHTLRQEEGRAAGREPQGATGDEDIKWTEFASDFSSMSLLHGAESAFEQPRRLPSPPPETILSASQSYMTRLLEVDDMCKEEMTRFNSIVPNLEELNQLASDWEVSAANFPDFSRAIANSSSDIVLGAEEPSSTSDDETQNQLRTQLDSIEEFISGLSFI